MNWPIYFEGLAITTLMVTAVWLLSVIKKDVSIVDSAWSLLILAAGLAYFVSPGPREWLVVSLLTIWAIRLSLHITVRSWGEPEDHRYQAIRHKYSPGFAFKSLFIIFIFQGVLAWLVSIPLLGAFTHPTELSAMQVMAAIIVISGIAYESIADWQLARFKSNPENRGKVMNQGLWHYSRHPNYFGEAVVWWGFALFAGAQGVWWVFISPLLMTFLLLKFSGVGLMESTITNRKPAYRDYIETTNAFFPGPSRNLKTKKAEGVRS